LGRIAYPALLGAFSLGPYQIKKARMGVESSKPASTPMGAVFLSYASQDAEAAQKICDALGAAGIEVWFDKSELRGGDVWDHRIREQIHSCRLFIPIISANTEARDEGYFRREWGFATDRTRDIAEKRAFLIPVVIDDTPERGASVPDKFHQIQWTRLPRGDTPPAFVARVAALLGTPTPVATANRPAPSLATAPPAQTRNRRNFWIALGLATLGIVIGGGWFALRQSGFHRHAPAETADQSPPAITEKSIAVLPFADLSEKHDQEYFADGMAEELIDVLANIPGLKVIGRTSSFQFKGKNQDLRAVGDTLRARYVVEGSVRRSGDRIRVTAQLIATADGVHRWSGTYDRQVTDVLDVQNQIAAGIARALEVEVLSSLHEKSAPLRSTEAYEDYLRALHAHDKYDERGFDDAIVYLKRALSLDPTFTPAGEALAEVLLQKTAWSFMPASSGNAQAREAAQSVLAANPRSATAHAVLCSVYTQYYFDWATANRECSLARQAAPHNPSVLKPLALYELAIGKWNDATYDIEAAIAADPLDPNTYETANLVYSYSGRVPDGEAAIRRTLAIAPSYAQAHWELGVDLLLQGKTNEAMLEMQKEPFAESKLFGLALADFALHRTEAAGRERSQLLALGEKEASHTEPVGDGTAFDLARFYAWTRQSDPAFFWLERALAQKDIMLYGIKGDPLLANIRSDQRYKAFLRKMNLPE
jgi:TolB-like protein/Tfp pilus assembly protein PilF